MKLSQTVRDRVMKLILRTAYLGEPTYTQLCGTSKEGLDIANL
jgi:hypothetical protein